VDRFPLDIAIWLLLFSFFMFDEVELLVLLLWSWDVNAMLFDIVVVVLPSVLNWCCCCVVVSISPSEKVIVLPMKIAPVIITRKMIE